MAQRTLLCVEPDDATLARIRDAVEPYEFDVTSISNGEQAVDWARKHQPDLIIVSVEPRKVGYAVCSKLKRSDDLKRIPLILTSSEETPQTFDQHKKLKSRADEYLIKPFSPSDLVAKIHSVLPLGDVAVNSEEIILTNDLDEISIADDDIVEAESSHANGSPFSDSPFGQPRRGAPPAELDSIFDQETDAAFAALQASEAEGTGPLASLPPRASGLPGLPTPWGDDPESWDAEATRATSIPELQEQADAAAAAHQASAFGGQDGNAPEGLLFPYEAPPSPEAVDEAGPAPSTSGPELGLVSDGGDDGRARPDDNRVRVLEQRLADADVERDRLNADIEELRTRLQAPSFSKDKEVLTLREIINKKEKDILDLRDAVDAKDRQVLDHKDRIREHERARRDLDEKSLGIEKQLMSANERIAALVHDKDKATDRERSLKTRLDDAHAEIQKAHDEVDTLKKRLIAQEERTRAELDRTRGELETRIVEMEELHRSEITRLTDERTAVETSLLDQHEAELARINASHTAEIEAERRKSAEELTSTVDRLQTEMVKLRREHEKALASLKEEQAVQVAAERQANQAASEARERDHKNEILGLRRRQEEELQAMDERRQRELADAETRRVADLDAAENRRRADLQARDEENHTLVAEMDRRHFTEKTETAERHRGELDQAHARAARSEGDLAARTEELSAAHRRLAGLEADLDGSRADLRDREVKLTQANVRVGELEARAAEYEEQIMRAFQKIRTDDRNVDKAKRALAVALSLLDERTAGSAQGLGGTKAAEGSAT